MMMTQDRPGALVVFMAVILVMMQQTARDEEGGSLAKNIRAKPA